MVDKLVLKGARQHNLKNINLEIPKKKIVVFTGLSGSGKSTLAFDTIYAEGQRRYVESLSAYARQFLELMDKPDIDSIEGLSPAISIQQKTTNKNPRSTVGTVTEIYDYLRLLFAKIGIPYCPKCQRKITSQTINSITDSILRLGHSKKSILILAPIVIGKKGTFEKLFDEFRKNGYSRVRIDGNIEDMESEQKLDNTNSNTSFMGINNHKTVNKSISSNSNIELDKQKKHNIEVLIDRLKPSIEERSRLYEAVQTAVTLGNGLIICTVENKDYLFSQHNSCPYCNISIGNLEPRSFSFNSPYGACRNCNGIGVKIEFDPDLIIPDKTKNILEGAIKPWNGKFASFRSSMLKDVGKKFGFSLFTPINTMKDEQLKVILYGTDDNIHFKYESRYSQSKWEYQSNFEGVIPNLERLYNTSESDSKREFLKKFMKERICEKCNGKRLRDQVLSVRINDMSIMEICDLSIDDCFKFFAELNLSSMEKDIAKNILKETLSRLEFLKNVGLNYLTLNRSTSSLSGGESQRIRLATQIGSNLTGVLYVLDEPTIGLHQRDNNRLINTLKKLRDIDNTLIIVEHDEEIIRNSDWIVDIGPGAGIHGGNVVAQGTILDIIENDKSITGKFLKGDEYVVKISRKKEKMNKWLCLYGANANNLKDVNVEFPIGFLTVVSGVSGSGKSTLINDILYKAIKKIFGSDESPGKHSKIIGTEHIDKIIGIDQSPIGRTPRSNAATYVELFTHIRQLFARTVRAKEMGFNPGRFSFNVRGGRCEACEGCGVKKIEMQFLPDVYVKCDECIGKRYNPETLLIKYKEKDVAEVLNFTVEEAMDFFRNIPIIYKKLKTLHDVGLGYIKLGQPATTFSGGEAQRIKLASELSRKDTGNTLYILDEPTTGLHFSDVKKLLSVLKRLTELGNTVIVIEHNLDVIASADWIIDLGPEGGNGGGKLVACGIPDDLIKYKDSSYTIKFLKRKLDKISNLNKEIVLN
ncbi:MAG: excinuclease ABC subunit UvrA [Nitrososphaeraceae archaeon]|nr:excinuclease ABC subunit UvrA [Nitrososphaeraceae archaeon]